MAQKLRLRTQQLNIDLVSGGIGTFEITTAARPKDFEATISLIGSKGVVKLMN